MRTTTIKIYKFNELSDKAKAKVLEEFRTFNVDFEDWTDYIIMEFKAIIEDYGINDVEVLYSGFGSQGDGASFTANVDIKKYIETTGTKGMENLLKDMANGCEPSISIKQKGHYVHEYTMYTDSETGGLDDLALAEFDQLEKDILLFAQSKAKELYRQLQKEYEDATEDNAVIESIELNEYEFTEDGSFYHEQ